MKKRDVPITQIATPEGVLPPDEIAGGDGVERTRLTKKHPSVITDSDRDAQLPPHTD